MNCINKIVVEYHDGEQEIITDIYILNEVYGILSWPTVEEFKEINEILNKECTHEKSSYNKQ